MKMGGLIAGVTVLAALTGALYWSDHHKPSEKDANSADTPPKILSLSESDIAKIDLKKQSGDEVALARSNSGKWEITAPAPYRADQETVSSILSTLSSLNSNRLIDEKASDLSQYGLAPPALEVDITKKDGKDQKLLIGFDTPNGSAAYAALAGDPRVFTLANYNKSSIDKGVKDLRDKHLLTVDSDKLSRVELVAPKQDIEFDRNLGSNNFGNNNDAWQIVKPKPMRADGLQVDELVRKLKDAKMDLNLPAEDAKKAQSAFASASPVAAAKLTDESGTQELQLRKTKDNTYYAKSSAVEGVYKVGGDIAQGLGKSLDDFRNKKLFDFGFTDPDKIEIHDGPKTYGLTRSGEDWSLDGKKMDATGVQSLLDKIRELSAGKFPDSGFTTSSLDIAVTSNSGKHSERALLAKSGDHYVAKREDDSTLYELDTKTVEDLQKAAADIKPAPTKK